MTRIRASKSLLTHTTMATISNNGQGDGQIKAAATSPLTTGGCEICALGIVVVVVVVLVLVLVLVLAVVLVAVLETPKNQTLFTIKRRKHTLKPQTPTS